jgi:site-specific DNA-methyltransferase (adenine-specific)
MTPYFSTDRGALYKGDCLEVMRSLPENHIDLTVTSPPYDNLRSYQNGVGDRWNFEVFKPIARELYRVTKEGGVVVWVVGDATINGSETGTSFKQALYFKECGFNLHDTMLYLADKIPLNHNRYEQAFEYMFVLSKKCPQIFNPITVETIWHNSKRHATYRQQNGGLKRQNTEGRTKKTKIKNNAWCYDVGFSKTTKDKIAYEHPAIFPEKLAQDHIISWSNPGCLVFDPFMGSGTVAKQAELLNRCWLGSEISEKYCKIAARRIEAAASQKSFEDYI